MAISRIPNRPRPLYPKGIQADSPEMGSFEATMAMMTAAMWDHCGGTRHTWTWPDPNSAPVCSLTAANTFTNFKMTETWTGISLVTSAYVPWIVHPNVIRTHAVAVIAASPIFPVSVRLRTKTLVDAVATVDGPSSINNLKSPVSAPLAGLWEIYARTLGYTNFYTLQCNIDSIAVPANNNVLLGLMAKYDSAQFVSNVAGQTYPVRLFSLSVAEELEIPNGGP